MGPFLKLVQVPLFCFVSFFLPFLLEFRLSQLHPVPRGFLGKPWRVRGSQGHAPHVPEKEEEPDTVAEETREAWGGEGSTRN